MKVSGTFQKTGENLGFTLLEILVVIAIIGVLVTLGLSSYMSATRQSKDARRMSDLKNIQNALEQDFGANNEYPTNCTPPATYFPQGLPKDPVSGTVYSALSCTVSTYCYCVTLENTTTGGNSTQATCADWGAGQFFCVTNLQ